MAHTFCDEEEDDIWCHFENTVYLKESYTEQFKKGSVFSLSLYDGKKKKTEQKQKKIEL